MKSIFTLLAPTILFFTNPVISQSITINEVLSSNTTVNQDEDGNYEDWVELYNYGGVAVNLNGFGLSDDVALPHKWSFPAVTLNPGQYLLVWCSDKNRTTPGSPLHTNFKIGATGETLYLTNQTTLNLATFPAIALPANVSYGKSPNGTGGYFYFNVPTPGQPNSTTSYSGILPDPVFTHTGGFYTAGINLGISNTTAGSTIIYTLDGSDPDPNNLNGTTYSYKNSYEELVGDADGPMLQNNYRSFTYSGPIPIADRSSLPNDLAKMSSTHHHVPYYIPTSPVFKGTVVRAKAIKSGSIPSKTVTRTYFVTPSGNSTFSLPVVSLSVTESKLFDYNNGIFVAGALFDGWRAANPTVNANPYNFDANFRIDGDISERTGNINYFENGVQKLNQDIGIRINGGYSRGWQSKSLRLVARSDYGNDSMNHKFFSDESLTTFNRLILRNSGGDFFDTMYRDALADELMKGTGMETMAYQPTITFVNGEYWGILNLRERFDEHYFKNVCGIEEVDLDFMENDQRGLPGSHYNNMFVYLTNNSLTIPANFDYIKTQMDVDNMRDYYIANIYYDNTDWPHYNTVFWRKKTAYNPNALYGLDGRWRAALKDNDDCFGSTTGVNNHNNLEVATDPNSSDSGNPPESTLVLRSLLANTTFKNDFINRFADLMNTYYLPSRFIAVSTAMKNRIQPEIQEHLDRWKATDYGWWEESINLMHSFANERPNYQRQHIRQKFGISSNINATLDVSDATHGYVKINTIDILPSTPGIATNPYPWTGIYFHNIPVKIKAIPLPGYAFSYWSGDSNSTSAEITITPTAHFSLTAHFIPSTTTGTPEIVYFWMMDTAIANDTPLTSLNSTFEVAANGVLQYQSSLAGYPFDSTSPNWRKASMERRNSPTPLNYYPEANGNLPFANSNMRGLQITQPFQSGGLQNTLIFNFSTVGYKDIKFAFAVLDEGAATGVTLEYATNAGTPIWTTAGMTTSAFPITTTYQRIEADLKTIPTVNNNVNFKMRLRFTGPNMTADTGARVTFNNISLEGVRQTLTTDENTIPDFVVYPNPATDVVHINHRLKNLEYTLYGIDGKLIQKGPLESDEINLTHLTSGLYLLQLEADGKSETKKILKR
ncbi:CotH kinase family protein [Flavobacterium saliperosum]|uniref:Por secretion system C-terminal sorting domain-containing protein n=1 Tax=Flavobacterium saliperosum TaxID=329186 RepID=A0A1G4W3A5_9FLAO|nr:CotH kinase family protein [Flavobacterium saliperosum]SCX16009.1 Por secretion system C-terminal sorting domain-containing protein [Flavobacterium saliperosum]